MGRMGKILPSARESGGPWGVGRTQLCDFSKSTQIPWAFSFPFCKNMGIGWGIKIKGPSQS